MKNLNSNTGSYFSTTSLVLIYTVFILIYSIIQYLHNTNYDLFFKHLQEDSILEWASFWSFFIAGIIYLKRGLRSTDILKSWWVWGLAIFCLFVAMEEISWGQRVLGYQPPEYFLEENYQQEFNIHNIIETDLRKWTLILIIAGYGIILPSLNQISKLNQAFKRFGIVSPSVHFIPIFSGILIFNIIYPFPFSGEVTELLLGMAFLYVALIPPNKKKKFRTDPLRLIIFNTLLVLVLSISTYSIIQIFAKKDTKKTTTSSLEVEALHNDFTNLITGNFGSIIPQCGQHSRVYTFIENFKKNKIIPTPEFKALTSNGMPEERAKYFIDPWNMPYCIKDQCTSDGRRMISVYSFGPDRVRQSNNNDNNEIRGDDIGKIIYLE